VRTYIRRSVFSPFLLKNIASSLPISVSVRKGMPPLRIVIVGAGIGGLSCAIVSRKQGLNVVVLEKAKKLTPVRSKMTCNCVSSRVVHTLVQ
jgi:heterodisulfide reductase subunit A-like polyferredoxin